MKKVQNKILEGAELINNKVVVASETGNKHVIKNVQVYMAMNGERLVVVQEEAELTHPQHGVVKIPRGIYSLSDIQDYLANQRLD